MILKSSDPHSHNIKMLIAGLSLSSDLFLNSLLKIPPEYRTEGIVRSFVISAKSFRSFYTSLFCQNKEILNDFLISFGRVVTSKIYDHMKYIKNAGDLDDNLYLIMSGKVLELCITYTLFAIRKKDYITHLAKLFYLNEKELFEQTIYMNKSFFPFTNNINDWIEIITDINDKLEMQKNFDDAKNEIKNSSYSKTNKYEDYLELIKYKPSKDNVDIFRQSMNDSEFSFKKSQNGDINVIFHLLLASYKIKNTLTHGDFIGCLSFTTKVRHNKTYMAIDRVECALLDKKNNSEVMAKLKKLKAWSIGKYFDSFYIFQDLNREYFESNIVQYFSYIKCKKGDLIIEQGDRYHGVYFVLKGEFKITTHQQYQNLDYLITNIKCCLKKNYTNYITSDNINLNQTIEKRNLKINPVLSSRNFLIKSRENREINLGISNYRQMIGTEEFYNPKNEINNMSAECISESAELFYLPKENFQSVKKHNLLIFQRIAKIIQQKAEFFLLQIQRYKENFLKEIEKETLNTKLSYKEKPLISTIFNKKIYDLPFKLSFSATNKQNLFKKYSTKNLNSRTSFGENYRKEWMQRTQSSESFNFRKFTHEDEGFIRNKSVSAKKESKEKRYFFNNFRLYNINSNAILNNKKLNLLNSVSSSVNVCRNNNSVCSNNNNSSRLNLTSLTGGLVQKMTVMNKGNKSLSFIKRLAKGKDQAKVHKRVFISCEKQMSMEENENKDKVEE